MKTKFLLLAVTAVAFIFSGCEKENIIDLTNIKAEVKLQCVDKEYSNSRDDTPDCTFVCSGYIGGFTGPASIEIDSDGYNDFFYRKIDFITVSGDATSFNFSFEDSDVREGIHNVEIEISSNGQIVFQSVCVIEI
ncbi:MAG: hypothetical protein E7139_01925 [Rikenellaceae bacterium]|nr:hypothetical protein [Rikenellaceae bacterium]